MSSFCCLEEWEQQSLFCGKGFHGISACYFWTAALLMTTIFRYYGDVEYRLNLNYKNIFTITVC